MAVNVGKMIEAQWKHEGYNELIGKLKKFQDQIFDVYVHSGIDRCSPWDKITNAINEEIRDATIRRDSLEV